MIALVTGATQGLGRALVDGLAARLTPADTVYLTGRGTLPATQGNIRTERLDVAEPGAIEALAATIRERHGGIDVVFGNAVMRVGPDDDPRAIVDEYTQVNNYATTRLLGSFAPLLNDNGKIFIVASSFGTLNYLAPALHELFDDLPTLDEVDKQVTAWRDAVKDGSAFAGAWPAFVNIPSKIAQVAAVRALAARRRDTDLARGILLAAVCPGMMNTPTSALWWDVSTAPSPADAAEPLLTLALNPTDPAHYGQLVRQGQILPWKPAISRTP